MVMSFLKSLPKTKDIIASADLMDFIIMANKDTAGVLRKIAEERDAIQKMADQAAKDMEEAAAVKYNYEALQDVYDESVEALKSDKAAFETYVIQTKDDLVAEQYTQLQREKAISVSENRVNDFLDSCKQDRANLDTILAQHQKDKDDAVAQAQAREDAAAAAEDRFNRKLESITSAANKG